MPCDCSSITRSVRWKPANGPISWFSIPAPRRFSPIAPPCRNRWKTCCLPWPFSAMIGRSAPPMWPGGKCMSDYPRDPGYPRDLRGYGRQTPDPHWPGGAYVAVQFVLNYEEGGENNILHGDAASEAFLSEIVGAQAWPGQRHWNMESIYEYGARAGFWRLHRLFTSRQMPVTVYGVATALQRSPDQVKAMLEADWEIASHGLKWIEHKDMSADEERGQIAAAIKLHTEVTGTAPLGWDTGR